MNAGLTPPPGTLRKTSSGSLRPRHVLLALWWWDERLLRGIARHGAGQGWILDTRVRFANRLPIRRKYDGVIVFSGRDTTLQRMARAIHCPIVNLDQHRPVPGACTVCCDDAAVGQAAAEHLLACGLERITFVQMRSRRSKSERARFSGLHRACLAAGIHAKAVAIRDLKRKLADGQMPLGLMAGNDEAAVEAIGICLEAGFMVPDDVAVVGVDNFPTVCLHAPVALSSIDLNLEQWGQRAAETLDAMMSSGKSKPTNQLVLNGGVIARASTDVAHRLDPRLAKAVRYIRDNFHRPMKISDLVRHVGMSRQSLQNYFQAQLHSTMHQQLSSARVSHAMQLMRRGDEGLARIATASGFRDYQHFHRIFTKHTGMTPSRWREVSAATKS
jgi:LacI family transcriptional regulator